LAGKPFRCPWHQFPEVVLHSPESMVKHHSAYALAKSGDLDAAYHLVEDTLVEDALRQIQLIVGDKRPYLVSAHALERSGVNAIPEALADEVGERLCLPVDSSIVQTNIVGHTGASGFARLARQALFNGPVEAGADYFLVDDFIGQGGTLANLRGYLEHMGATVLGATSLTGKPYSAKITVEMQQLTDLRSKHGKDLEIWWEDRFGHAFDCFTQSEARYLTNTSDADTIRDRITAQEQT
jgi:hypothetical protein